MAEYVFAKRSCMVAHGSGSTMLVEGQVWAAEADLVRERPDLFTSAPIKVRGRLSGEVERATRATGERRRGRKRSRTEVDEVQAVDDQGDD